jgi:hypothetical protein
MYETVLERRARLGRAVREFFDLSACRVFTVWQQIVWALACAAIGAAGLALAVNAHLDSIEPVAVFSGVIERAGPAYSVYRIRFMWREREISSCHVVIYEDRKWAVKC